MTLHDERPARTSEYARVTCDARFCTSEATFPLTGPWMTLLIHGTPTSESAQVHLCDAACLRDYASDLLGP